LSGPKKNLRLFLLNQTRFSRHRFRNLGTPLAPELNSFSIALSTVLRDGRSIDLEISAKTGCRSLEIAGDGSAAQMKPVRKTRKATKCITLPNMVGSNRGTSAPVMTLDQ